MPTGWLVPRTVNGADAGRHRGPDRRRRMPAERRPAATNCSNELRNCAGRPESPLRLKRSRAALRRCRPQPGRPPCWLVVRPLSRWARSRHSSPLETSHDVTTPPGARRQPTLVDSSARLAANPAVDRRHVALGGVPDPVCWRSPRTDPVCSFNTDPPLKATRGSLCLWISLSSLVAG